MKRLLGLFCMTLLLCGSFSISVLADGAEEDPVENTGIVDISNHIYTYGEMCQDICALQEQYPEYIRVASVAKSADERDVWQLIIGNPSAEKAIYVHSTIHAREWMNSWLVMKQMETILQNWNTVFVNNITYGQIFEQCAVYVIPMLNPDGVTLSQLGVGAIKNEQLRANLYNMDGISKVARWKANACGVDLNRNFSVGWGNKVNTITPASQNYNGVAPFTEPELQAVIYTFAQREFDYAISYHSMEGAIYWNVGQTGELYEKNRKFAEHMRNVTGYQFGISDPVHGLDYNWLILDRQVPTALLETGTVACPLPYSQWDSLWRSNKDVIVQAAIFGLCN